jgi:hypothetical protein
MERVLVTLGLVLVLEAVAAKAALILLLGFVSTRGGGKVSQRIGMEMTSHVYK